MNSSKACRIPKQTTSEDETFWQKHITAYATSGLSKSAYCHAQQVDYARFIYWSRKAAKASSQVTDSSLIHIKLAAEQHFSAGVLCTLQFKHGGCLQIHDTRVLTFIFDKLN